MGCSRYHGISKWVVISEVDGIGNSPPFKFSLKDRVYPLAFLSFFCYTKRIGNYRYFSQGLRMFFGMNVTKGGKRGQKTTYGQVKIRMKE